jgi:hypothetical protein
VRDEREEEQPEREQERNQSVVQEGPPEAVAECSQVSVHLQALTTVKRL